MDALNASLSSFFVFKLDLFWIIIMLTVSNLR
jgi:hypothetical protein